MKRSQLTTAAAIALVASATLAQTPASFVPLHGQSTTQQELDKAACMASAKQDYGTDPNTPQQQGQSTPAASGAASGAALGAAVGTLGGRPLRGAAIGALFGGSGRRRRLRAAEKKAHAEAASRYGTCMTERGYTAK